MDPESFGMTKLFTLSETPQIPRIVIGSLKIGIHLLSAIQPLLLTAMGGQRAQFDGVRRGDINENFGPNNPPNGVTSP